MYTSSKQRQLCAEPVGTPGLAHRPPIQFFGKTRFSLEAFRSAISQLTSSSWCKTLLVILHVRAPIRCDSINQPPLRAPFIHELPGLPSLPASKVTSWPFTWLVAREVCDLIMHMHLRFLRTLRKRAVCECVRVCTRARVYACARVCTRACALASPWIWARRRAEGRRRTQTVCVLTFTGQI